MQYSWINKQKNSDLIIFFSGWGMDAKSVSLDYGNFDIIIFYNYEDITIKNGIIEEFLKYKNIYLIAWSMGVIMSTLLINKLNSMKQSIAINGTLKIIDNKFGIPTKIFNSTLNNLNETTIKSFFKNMGYRDFKIPNRSFESQFNELKFIEKFYNNKFNANFDKILIGEKDIIIPFKNQKRAWEDKNFIIIDGGGHYIFNKFKKWEEIIKC